MRGPVQSLCVQLFFFVFPRNDYFHNDHRDYHAKATSSLAKTRVELRMAEYFVLFRHVLW